MPSCVSADVAYITLTKQEAASLPAAYNGKPHIFVFYCNAWSKTDRLQDWRCNQETVQWMKKYKSCTCCPPFSLSISFYWALFDELTEPTSPHMFSRVHKGCVENQLHKIKLDTQQKCRFEIKTSVVRNCTKSNVTILSQLTVTAQWKKSTVTVKLPGR